MVPAHLNCKMRLVTLKELEWIHYCALFTSRYIVLENSGRLLEVMIECHNDLGYVPWNGRQLRLSAMDVAFMKHVVHNVAGPETIDAILTGFADSDLENEIEANSYRAMADVRFSICFHSGSEIAVD